MVLGSRMLVAIKNSQEVTQRSLKALLSSEYSEIKDLPHMWFTPEETYPTIKTLPSIAVIDIKSRDHNVVTFVNSLAHERTMLVSVLVNSPDLMVSTITLGMSLVRATHSGHPGIRAEAVACVILGLEHLGAMAMNSVWLRLGVRLGLEVFLDFG